MSWDNVAFKAPGDVQRAFNDAEDLLDPKIDPLNAVLLQLSLTPVIDVANLDANFSEGAFVGNSDFYGYSKHVFKTVVVHPWVEGIGQGVGHYRYLSPRIAVNTLANKLLDTNDDFSPAGQLDYFAILITANSYADMGITLQRFLAVYSEPTVYMCSRRCIQLAQLESAKTLLPVAAINSRWDSFTESNSGRWRRYTELVGAPYSLYSSYEHENDSLEEAVGLVAKKKAAIIELSLENARFELNTIKFGFGKKFFIKAKKPNEAAKILRESDIGGEYPISVAFVYCGAVDSLDDLYGLF